MERIDDPDDERIADYVRLTDASARQRGTFIAESLPVIRQALASGYRVRSVLLSPHRYAELGDVAEQVFVADQPILRSIAGFDVHRGALAAVERPPLPPLADLLARSQRIAVLEAVSDHENMGSLFRNAAAFGIDAVLLCPRCSDPLYRRSVRVSMGHVLHVPFTRIDPWPEALALVRAAGFTTLALTPEGDAEPVDEVDAVARPAFLLGAEGPGLSGGALAVTDRRIRIPMAKDVDSLNVATAAAIAFHRIWAWPT
jgi:tRNA G18 (ribose-2'-O)-methylase SpoU